MTLRQGQGAKFAISSPDRVTYGSDASVIGQAGIPVVVFGPGNIDDAHQPDESVDLAQVQRAADVIEMLIRGYGR